MRLSDQEVDQYKEDGFIIVRGLFDPTLAGQMRDHFMKLRAQGPRPGDYGGTTDHMEDANHKYPRLKNMHEWDTVSTQWSRWHSMLAILEQLLEDKPVIYQSDDLLQIAGCPEDKHSTRTRTTSQSIQSSVCGSLSINLSSRLAS